MNTELTIRNYNGVNVIESREVAKMIGKNHAHLCRDIQGYMKVLNQNPKLDSDKFFIESSYKSGTGKEYTCYLLTKQGCEMVANKMTGEKGVLFTAEYVQAFNKMEEQIKQQNAPKTYLEALKALVAAEEEKLKLKEANESLQVENQKQNQIIGELKPKADYTDTILKNPGLITITQIAKDYGMSGTSLNKKLHDLHVQYKAGTQWLLYSEHHDKGYTHSETVEIKKKDGTKDIKLNTKWTTKGRLFLYNLLKENNVLPLIEQQKG